MPLSAPPQTFTWPAKRGPLSKNIQKPECWQDEGILYPHELFRWYFSEIREIMNSLDIKQTWKLKLFAKWIVPRVLDSLHHHHDAEETLYNPLITSNGGTLTPALTGDHESIMDDINKAKAILAKIDNGDSLAFGEFKVHFEKLMVECEEHFDDEEIQYPAQLKATSITEQQEAETVTKIIQSIGLEGNKTMLPAICYAVCLWGGEAKMQAFFGNVPPPIQFLCQKCWLDDFWVNNLCVIEALKSSSLEEYNPPTPQCGACAIQ